MAGSARNQCLYDHGTQGGSYLHANLLLLVFRIHVDETVHGGAGVLSMKGCEHQVAGFHCGQCGGNGFQVSKLTDFDNVRILTQRTFQRFREAFRISAHFSLAHHATLMLMHEFDRVFDGDDMVGAFRIRLVHDCGQCGRLTGTGRAAYKHQTTRQQRKVGDTRVNSQFLRGFDFRRNGTQRGAYAHTVAVYVHAEAQQIANGEGDIKFQIIFETFHLQFVGHDFHCFVRVILRPHAQSLGGAQLAIHAQHWRVVDYQVQIGRIELNQLADGRHEFVVRVRMFGAQRLFDLLGLDLTFFRNGILVGVVGFRHYEIREWPGLRLGLTHLLLLWLRPLESCVLRNVSDGRRHLLRCGFGDVGLSLSEWCGTRYEGRWIAVDLLDRPMLLICGILLGRVSVLIKLQAAGTDWLTVDCCWKNMRFLRLLYGLRSLLLSNRLFGWLRL